MRADGVLDDALQRDLADEAAYAASALAPAQEGAGADERLAHLEERADGEWRRSVSHRVRSHAARERDLAAVRAEAEALAAEIRDAGVTLLVPPELVELGARIEQSLGTGAGSAVSAPSTAPTTATVAVDGGTRMSLDEYLRSLEAEVDSAVAATPSGMLALSAPRPSISLLDDDGELGG